MADREAVVVTPIAAVAADAASQLAGTQPPGSEGWASTVADGVTQAVADTPPVVAEPSDAADTDGPDGAPPADTPPPPLNFLALIALTCIAPIATAAPAAIGASAGPTIGMLTTDL